jgi:hypothetical protein
MCPLEALKRGHPAPLPPLGARWLGSRNSPHESRRNAFRQLLRSADTMRTLVPQASEHDGERQHNPDGDREREHDEGNDEDERLHPWVVVVPESRDVPRTGDPPKDTDRRHNSRGYADERT